MIIRLLTRGTIYGCCKKKYNNDGDANETSNTGITSIDDCK